MQIKTSNKAEHLALMGILYAHGYTYYGNNTPEDAKDANETYFTYNTTVVRSDNSLAGNNDFRAGRGTKYTFTTDIKNIIEHLNNVPLVITVSNVGEYEAVVSVEGIKVGCQNISFEKFAEIAKAVEQVTSKSNK